MKVNIPYMDAMGLEGSCYTSEIGDWNLETSLGGECLTLTVQDVQANE